MEPLAVPAQEGMGLENEQRLLSPPHSTCQHAQPEAIAAMQVESFHVEQQNAQLMTLQGILDNCDRS